MLHKSCLARGDRSPGSLVPIGSTFTWLILVLLNGWNAVNDVNQTAGQLLQKGVEDEDDVLKPVQDGRFGSPQIRLQGHFYNPKDGSGLTDLVFGIFGKGPSSLIWAANCSQVFDLVSGTKVYHGWKPARKHQLAWLT